MIDTWDPAQYEKFQREREQPFFDLLGMVRPEPLMRVVDLGCGTGKQTRALHERLQARETMGLDQSPKMLESQANAALPAGLHFEVGTIEDFPGIYGTFDLVFSNAALHWVDDHDALLPRLASAVGPRGQMAFQVPAMHDEPCHEMAARLAAAVEANVRWSMHQLLATPEARARLKEGVMKLVGAVYELETGRVRFLP